MLAKFKFAEVPEQFRRYGQHLLNFAVPGECCLCRTEVDAYRLDCVVCQECQKEWLSNENNCANCSARQRQPVPSYQKDCGWCRHLNLSFDSVTSLANYEGELARVLVEAKSGRGKSVAWDLGFLLADAVAARFADVAPWVVPVPMHWRRRMFRGTNQAKTLANSVCQRNRWKIFTGVRCIRSLAKQSDLSFNSRKKNVRGAFAIGGTVPPDVPVLLIDDIMTTGSILSELGKLLRKSGVKSVHVAVVARSTPIHLNA